MTDDLLARATKSLRDETADDGGSGRFTRARIMASAQERRVRKRTRVAFLIPIAATFVAASAVGATGGPKQALEAVARVFGIHRAEPAVQAKEPSIARGSGTTRRPERPALQPPEPPPREETAPPPPPPAPEPVPPRAEPPKASSESPRVSASAGSAQATDPAFELYRTAHRVHFVEHDSARALAAWDAYLRAAPRGSFAVEARYNRALCLVRLKRTTEAQAALTPFAEGRYGGYRQAEAARLLEALGKN
jgi:hypothetical protein